MKKIGIVGGGASGIMAAITAAENGASVVLFERKDKIGKKILVTGNGRCNFSNANLSEGCYYTDDSLFVKNVLNRFDNDDLCSFFKGLGMLIKDKNGYFYPACEQASTVLDVLRFALKEEGVKEVTDAYVTDIKKNGDEYIVVTENGEKYSFDNVILSTGGKAGIGKKEYANGYDLLKSLGHSVTKLYPALTQIKCSGYNFKAVAGVRSDCTLSVYENKEQIMAQAGEILFTDYGISGIVSFQISHCVAKLLDGNSKISLVIDMLPGIEKDTLSQFVMSKKLLHENLTVSEFFTGFLNKKLNNELIKDLKLNPNELIKNIDSDYLIKVFSVMKCFVVYPTGVNDFDQAQVTGGGIPTSELTCDLESKFNKGLYITGELIDVDGICGGYNLQWAFSTGRIAGKYASLNK